MKRTRTRKMRRDPDVQDLIPANLLPSCERRYGPRHVAHQHVAIRFRTSNLICDLIDLSETGAKICVLDGVVPNIDEKVVLTLFDGTAIEGQSHGSETSTSASNSLIRSSTSTTRLDFEDLGSAYFGKAVTLQKTTRRS